MLNFDILFQKNNTHNMATEIKCPNCNHAFPMEEVMTEEYKKELREQMASFKKKQLEEFEKKALVL